MCYFHCKLHMFVYDFVFIHSSSSHPVCSLWKWPQNWKRTCILCVPETAHKVNTKHQTERRRNDVLVCLPGRPFKKSWHCTTTSSTSSCAEQNPPPHESTPWADRWSGAPSSCPPRLSRRTIPAQYQKGTWCAAGQYTRVMCPTNPWYDLHQLGWYTHRPRGASSPF